MPIIYTLFVIFFLTPGLLAIAYRIAAGSGYINEHGKLNIGQEMNTTHFYLAITTITCVYLITLISGYNFLAKSTDLTVMAAPFTVLTLTTIALFLSVFRALQIYQRAKLFFNILGTYFALWITWATSKYAGQSISEKTGLSASEFPTAQQGFTLLMTPFFWAIVATTILLACYLITAVAIIMAPNTADTNEENRRIVKHKNFIYSSLFIGLALTPLLIINITEKILTSEWTEQKLTQILVFSGYPLDKHKCIESESNEDRFTILTSQKIAVAKYISEYKYKFFTVECPKEEAN